MMDATESIKKILVVGAGTMGHGIAQSFAQEGYHVALFSRKTETLERARTLIKSSLEAFVRGGLLNRDRIPAIIQRIEMSQSLEEAARDADIVFETVVEDRDVKINIFNQLERFCPAKALLASNTTALNIFDFIHTSRPDKLLIAHWYTPPQLMPLVDVVKGEKTSAESVDIMVQVLKKIGKEPLVLKKFVSGYIVSRLQIATTREILYLLDNDIVTAEELDLAAKTGLAIRMMVLGLVQRIDFGGLDLTAKNLDNPYVQKQLTPADYKPRKIYELVEAGHLGIKTGKGFYDYAGKSEAEVCFARDLKLMRMLKAYRELKEME